MAFQVLKKEYAPHPLGGYIYLFDVVLSGHRGGFKLVTDHTIPQENGWHEALKPFTDQECRDLLRWAMEASSLPEWKRCPSLLVRLQVVLRFQLSGRVRRKIEDRLRKNPELVESLAYLLGIPLYENRHAST